MPFTGWPLVRESPGNLIFFKVREFCKMVKEILNINKVREESGNFPISAQTVWNDSYLAHLSYCGLSMSLVHRSSPLCGVNKLL